NPAGGEDICVAMPERIECVDDRSLLIANHPHFLEMDTDRRQIFRNVADVLGAGLLDRQCNRDGRRALDRRCSMRWRLSSRLALACSRKSCARDVSEGDIGTQLGEIAKANPAVAIGSYVRRSAAGAQHECGAARPRWTEARAGETRGRGHAGASAASTIR